MRTRSFRSIIMLFLFAGLLLGFSVGCTKYANQEDLQLLEEQKEAAIAAEKKRDNLRMTEKPKVEKEKAGKEAELAKAQDEKAKVSDCVEKRQAAEAEGEEETK